MGENHNPTVQRLPELVMGPTNRYQLETISLQTLDGIAAVPQHQLAPSGGREITLQRVYLEVSGLQRGDGLGG